MHSFRRDGSILERGIPFAAILLAGIMAPLASAGLLSTASVTLGGACIGSQTVAGSASASASLPCASGGVSASATSSFDTTVASLSTLTFSDSAGYGDVATSTASFDYELVVLGGTGTGFLALDFDYTIGGNKDAQASANSHFAEMLNGSALNSGALCTGPIAIGGPFSCSSAVPIGFGFTYGVPFELSFSFSGTAGGGLASANISGNGDFNYAILTTGTAIPNPNGTLNLVPEPSSSVLEFIAIFALAAVLLGRRPRLRV